MHGGQSGQHELGGAVTTLGCKSIVLFPPNSLLISIDLILIPFYSQNHFFLPYFWLIKLLLHHLHVIVLRITIMEVITPAMKKHNIEQGSK